MSVIRDHRELCEQLRRQTAEAYESGSRILLRKRTSNLFRPPVPSEARPLDASGLCHVLQIDDGRRMARVEGLLTYQNFVEAALRHGFLPAVVPQLKTITVGGAVSGLGIESSSFRYGLVHETVDSMDVLLGDGTIATCSRTENDDFFFGLPNSYGTLGYILALSVRLIPVKPFVHLVHTRYSEPESFFAAMSNSGADYADGVIFDPGAMYLTEARFEDRAPHVSDYTFQNIYYRSIRQLPEDWMTVRQYIWRWDTDWFWCSKHFHLEKPWLRRFAKPWLNSRTYQKWMRWAQRYLPGGSETESVIQDAQIPLENASGFLAFLHAEVPVKPVWVCPFRTSEAHWTLTSLAPSSRYINFGFWDVVRAQGMPGDLNRKIERRVSDLGGTKALYSSSYYTEEQFWRIYDRAAYSRLKAAADPRGIFPGLYETVVRHR